MGSDIVFCSGLFLTIIAIIAGIANRKEPVKRIEAVVFCSCGIILMAIGL